MITLSSGLKSRLLNGSGFLQCMQYGVIRLYASVRVESPNNAISFNPIATITQEGHVWNPAPSNLAGGLQLSMASQSALQKRGTWVLKGVAAGTALWMRWCGPEADDNAYSEVLPRLDADCGVDLILTDDNYSITLLTSEAIQRFVVGFASSTV